MTHDAALAFLERWLNEARDPDLQQRAWKQAHIEGGLLAYERLGVLSPEEVGRWRERLASPNDQSIDPSAALSGEAIAAGEEYLAGLVGQVTPLRRTADPAAFRRNAECDSAIAALHAVGAIDEVGRSGWAAKVWGAQAPWLDPPVIPPPRSDSTVFAVWVPPEDAEQAAADAVAAAEWEARPQASEVHRVIVGLPRKHADLAIIAVVIHEDATALHFHFLGEKWGSPTDQDDWQDWDALNARLTPPQLRDEAGTLYEPVDNRPDSLVGAGGVPSPDRRHAVTGVWLYTPAAPPDTQRFTATRDGHSWNLSTQQP